MRAATIVEADKRVYDSYLYSPAYFMCFQIKWWWWWWWSYREMLRMTGWAVLRH